MTPPIIFYKIICLLQKMLTVLRFLIKKILQPHDPKGKIEISGTLLHIYRAPENVFQEIICLRLKMSEDFEKPDLM